MNIAGIIAEYNPFHNGHALHVRRTREETGCDYVVAAMSGSFTQRGEAVICDKWVRARMALQSGVDLVVELPALFAVRPAQAFALGGVTLLGRLGVDVLSFGAEVGDLSLLERMADLLAREPSELTERIRRGLGAGQSHARARGDALCDMLRLDPALANAPNTALALEYLAANKKLKRPMNALAVKRTGDYHALELRPIASASAVRKAVRERGVQAIEGSVPPGAYALLERLPEGALAQPDALDALLLDRLRTAPPSELAGLADVSEGLHIRVRKMAERATSREELRALIKCKRYTMARIDRILTSALLGLTRELAARYASGAPYARVLAFRESARPLMRHILNEGQIDLVTDPMRIKDDPCFALERRATDLWGLSTTHPPYRRAARDLTERIVIVK